MPSIRSSVLRDMRDTYARLGFAVPAEVDAALAANAEWSDAAHLLRLHELNGPARAFTASRDNSLQSWSTSSLFVVLEKQALKLLGRRPQAMMRFYPGAYAMAMRGAGTASYADGVNGGRIDITGAPPFMVEHPGFRAGLRGGILGLLDRLGWRGDVSEARCTSLATTMSVTFTMRWWRPLDGAQQRPVER